MRKQLQVIKADGSVEEYLHTKIWATLNHAFDSIGQSDSYMTEQLADVVTYYLYHTHNKMQVRSSEILAIIKVVLTNTGYEEAAVSLSEHHWERQLKRNRLEVQAWDTNDWANTEELCAASETSDKARWNKSIIVDDLVSRYQLDRQTARAIAAMAEERILAMGLGSVPTALIKQLVLSDTATVLRAQEQLQLVQ
jgi:hypothetical protein